MDLWEGSTTFNEIQLIIFEREKLGFFKFDITLNNLRQKGKIA